MDSKRPRDQSNERNKSKVSYQQSNDAQTVNDLRASEIEMNKRIAAIKSNDFNPSENKEYFYNFLYNNLLLNQIGSVPLPFALPPSSSSSILSSLGSIDYAAANQRLKSPSSFANSLFQSAPHFKTSKSNFQIDSILNNKNSLDNWSSHSLTTSLLEDFNRHQLKIRTQQEQEKLFDANLHG